MNGSSSFASLRRYDSAAIVAAGEELRADFRAGAVNAGEFWREQDLFRFREPGGDDWYLDVQTGQWYVDVNGQWEPALQPSIVLEGSDLLAATVWSTGLENVPELAATISDGPDACHSPVRLLESVTEDILTAYQHGEICSNDADALLARQCLIDHDGCAWQVGVRSGCWYRFQDCWEQAKAAPPDETLLELTPRTACRVCGEPMSDGHVCAHCGERNSTDLTDLSDAIEAALLSYALLGVGSVPESVTTLWEVPRSFPDERLDGGTEQRSLQPEWSNDS